MDKLIVFSLLIVFCYGQDKKIEGKINEAQFHANTSTIFGLLDMSPAIVNNFGTFKEIKVDWFLKNNTIYENIAVETYPFWYTIFKRKSYDDFRKMPYLAKKLADASLSIGNKKIETNQTLGLSLNFNLYKKNDIYENTNLINNISDIYNFKEQSLLRESMRKEMLMELEKDATKKEKLASEIKELDKRIEKISEEEEKQVDTIIENYKKSNWNKGFINVGVGYLLDYYLPENNKKFTFISNDVVTWLHYGVPFTKHGVLSLLHRYYFIKQQIATGFNIRFGTREIPNCFIENFIHYKIGRYNETLYIINTGGNFKAFDKFALGIGVRFTFDYRFKFQDVKPVYNININF